MTGKRLLKKISKILLWVIGIFIGLVLLVLILIQIPAVQNFAKNKVVAYLQDKLHTKVEVEKLSIAFPKQIVLEHVYFEDQKKDTLLYGGKIQVDIALFKLLSKKIEANYIELDDMYANIYRIQPDTSFNFDYIVKAFAGDSTATADTTSGSSFSYDLDKLVLNNIRFKFHDDGTGMNTSFGLGHFDMRIGELNPDKSIYHIKELNLEGVETSLHQYTPLITLAHPETTPADSTSSAPMDLQLGKIGLKNIMLDYRNDVSAMAANFRLSAIKADIKNTDMARMQFDINSLVVDSTNSSIVLNKTNNAAATTTDTTQSNTDSTAWKIVLNDFEIRSTNFAYDNNNEKHAGKGVDYSHLHITNLNTTAHDLLLSPVAYKGVLNDLSLHEQSGLAVQKLQTNFLYGEKNAQLNDLVLLTDKTTLQGDISVAYPSIDSISKNIALLYINSNIQKGDIARNDILLFTPGLEKQLPGNGASVYSLKGNVKGYLGDLNIPSLSLSGFGNTSLEVAGTIKGLPDAEKTNYNLQLGHLYTTKKDILSILPANTVPSNIQLPGVVRASGSFKGTMNDFVVDMKTQTDKGSATVAGSVKGMGKYYNIKTALNKIDLGYILKQPENFGTVSLNATAKGNGTDYKKMTGVFDVHVTDAFVKKYDYKNVLLHADLKNGQADITSSADDANIRYKLTGQANLQQEYPAVKMSLLLDTLNLYALHLSDSIFTIHTKVDADMASVNPDALDGTVTLAETRLVQNDRPITLDSALITATHVADSEKIKVNTEMFVLNWSGKYKITQTADALVKTIDQYYHIPYTPSSATTEEQNWVLEAHVFPQSPSLLKLVPALEGSDTIGAAIHFNSAENNLQMHVGAPVIQYAGQTVNGFAIDAATDDKQLGYNIAIHDAHSGSLNFYSTTINGNLADNKLTTDITLKDAAGKKRYQLAANLNQPAEGTYQLSLNPDSLLLNYKAWQIATGNSIEYSDAGITAKNFTLSHNGQSLGINSQSETPNAPLDISFKDFSISTISSFAGQDSLLMDGVINGTATVKDATKGPFFTSKLNIADLSYKKDTLGNIALNVNNAANNTLQADVTVTGRNMNLQLNGSYDLSNSNMNMKLNIDSIRMASLVTLSQGQLLNASGNLLGNVDIKGTPSTPSVNGSLRFKNASLQPALLGSVFQLPDEAISVQNDNISFNNFTMVDESKNKAVLNGTIKTKDFLDYNFDLAFKADDFSAVNSTQTDNHLFYGKLNLDADVTIKGSMNAPVIRANIRANKATDFTFVLPSPDPEVASREGIVRFVDMDAPADTTQQATDTTFQYRSLAGADVDVTIVTDTAAAFTLVIDERNGDALKVKGDAEITGGIDPAGKLTLTGNYQLRQGSYQLTLSLLKRKFTIQNGSLITWKGDPTDADVDITALYQVDAAPIDLMEAEYTGTGTSSLTRYKQRLPVQVFMHMQGELMKPTISFSIGLPSAYESQWKDVSDKLDALKTNESELNKQVFALLLLGRFTQEDPFVTDAGTSNEAFVRQSVSRLLTDQLNKLAGDLVKGVDLNFGLNSDEDYSTGTGYNRTDLTVGVSKSLLNDRLKVSVGSDFLVEGAENTTQNASNIAGDVSLDYQLSKDGRYRLRAYRKNEYEGVVEGQVVETGLTFAFTLDYDQFRELFNKSKKRKTKRK